MPRRERPRAPINPKVQPVHCRGYTSHRRPDLLLGDELVDEGRGGFQLFNVENDILSDRVVERIARLFERRLYRRTYGGDERWKMTRQWRPSPPEVFICFRINSW
jgi:hypothetical protein